METKTLLGLVILLGGVLLISSVIAVNSTISTKPGNWNHGDMMGNDRSSSEEMHSAMPGNMVNMDVEDMTEMHRVMHGNMTNIDLDDMKEMHKAMHGDNSEIPAQCIAMHKNITSNNGNTFNEDEDAIKDNNGLNHGDMRSQMHSGRGSMGMMGGMM